MARSLFLLLIDCSLSISNNIPLEQQNKTQELIDISSFYKYIVNQDLRSITDICVGGWLFGCNSPPPTSPSVENNKIMAFFNLMTEKSNDEMKKKSIIPFFEGVNYRPINSIYEHQETHQIDFEGKGNRFGGVSYFSFTLNYLLNDIITLSRQFDDCYLFLVSDGDMGTKNPEKEIQHCLESVNQLKGVDNLILCSFIFNNNIEEAKKNIFMQDFCSEAIGEKRKKIFDFIEETKDSPVRKKFMLEKEFDMNGKYCIWLNSPEKFQFMYKLFLQYCSVDPNISNTYLHNVIMSMKYFQGYNNLNFYDDFQIIGNGANGMALNARVINDVNTQERFENVVIKVIFNYYDTIQDTELYKLYCKEYEFLKQTPIHQNIIKMYNIFQDTLYSDKHTSLFDLLGESPLSNELNGKQCMFIILEYHPRGNLLNYLEENEIDLPTKLKYCSEVGSALDFLWKYDYVNMDMKLDNILITNDDHIVLIDFGETVKVNREGRRLLNDVAGNQLHRAPEIYNQEGQFVDLRKQPTFSFGVIIWEILFGKHPIENYLGGEYEVPNMNEYDLPLDLKKLIKNLISFNPDSRPLISEAYFQFNENIIE